MDRRPCYLVAYSIIHSPHHASGHKTEWSDMHRNSGMDHSVRKLISSLTLYGAQTDTRTVLVQVAGCIMRMIFSVLKCPSCGVNAGLDGNVPETVADEVSDVPSFRHIDGAGIFTLGGGDVASRCNMCCYTGNKLFIMVERLPLLRVERV